jgi:HSP20 family protein
MAQLPVHQRNRGGGLTTHQQHPMDLFRRQFDALFDNFFRGWPAPFFGGEDGGSMRVWDFDVQEGDKDITIRAEMPGFNDHEIDVRLDNDVLTIQAEKQEQEDGRREFRSFRRSITLPGGIDAEKVQATYRNGVLELHIPRTEGRQARRIQVQGAGGAGGASGQPAKREGEAKPEPAAPTAAHKGKQKSA